MSAETTTPPGTPPRDFSVPPADAPRALWTLSPVPSRSGSEEPINLLDGGEAREAVEEIVWQREEVGLVEYQKGPRRRHRKTTTEEKGTPGKPSWIWGTKLVFFESRKDQWLQASEAEGGPGAFYTKVTRLYMLKYPEGMRDNQDLERDIPDPPDALARRVVNSNEPSDVVRARAKDHKRIRDRVAGWYRTKFGSLVNNAKKDFVKLFSGTLSAAPPKPGRPQLLHFYSRKFYNERIKQRFVDRMQALKRRAEYTGDPEPEALAVLPIVRKEAWEDETPGFQEEVREALEREYKMAVKGWEASLADSPTRTPEEMAATLANAAFYLQPFVDAIHERFGMVASLLIAGPVGKLGGAIGMQSVHSGTTKGLAPLTWPLHDRIGFAEVERSMVAFAKDCFSDAECRARAVTSTTSAPAPTTSSNAAASTSSGPRSDYLMNGWGNRMGNEDTSGGYEGDGDNAAVNAEKNEGKNGEEGGSVGSAEQLLREEAGPSGGEEAVPTGDGAEEGEGSGAQGEEAEDDEATVFRKKIDAMWQRNDRSEWSYELNRAHVGFERGKYWGGIEWARCVSGLYDFEGAMGWEEEGGRVTTVGRPTVFQDWFARQRQWWSPMSIGTVGSVGEEGTYADVWWSWWRSIQPGERIWDEGELSCPPEADWTELRRLHGKNGFVLILAALLWWGDVVGKDDTQKKDPLAFLQWERAVMDVTWVLGELQAPIKGKGVRGKPAKGKQPKKRTRAEMQKEPEEGMDEHEAEGLSAPAKKGRKAKKTVSDATEGYACTKEDENGVGVRRAGNEIKASVAHLERRRRLILRQGKCQAR
ncbi:hypothetical protein C8R43DRAFT_944959 [Mycena crocata]|nr:hypothetical protein C8R43DRAFT_944959 [Mycena crocata]